MRRGFLVTQVIAWLAVFFLLAPIFVVILVAFTPASFISLPPLGEYSVKHFSSLGEGRWAEAAISSLTVGLAVAAFSAIIGSTAAIGLWRSKPRIQNLGRAILLSPLIVPPVMIGLAIYRPWIGFGLLDTWIGVVVAHTIIGVPLVAVTVSASLTGLDHRIDDAARSLGANTYERVVKIILPNAKFGIVAGAGLAFIASWDEFVVTLFITQRKMTTLPLQLYQGIKDNFDPVIAAVAALLILATLFCVLLRIFYKLVSNQVVRSTDT